MSTSRLRSRAAASTRRGNDVNVLLIVREVTYRLNAGFRAFLSRSFGLAARCWQAQRPGFQSLELVHAALRRFPFLLSALAKEPSVLFAKQPIVLLRSRTAQQSGNPIRSLECKTCDIAKVKVLQLY